MNKENNHKQNRLYNYPKILIPQENITFSDLLWLYPENSYRLSTSGNPESIKGVKYYIDNSIKYPLKAVFDKRISNQENSKNPFPLYNEYYFIIDDKILVLFFDYQKGSENGKLVSQLIYDLPDKKYYKNGINLSFERKIQHLPRNENGHTIGGRVLKESFFGEIVTFRELSDEKIVKSSLQLILDNHKSNLETSSTIKYRIIGNVIIFRVYRDYQDYNSKYDFEKIYKIPPDNPKLKLKDLEIDISYP